ncbi:MAG: single-stranded DNA-binding protein [Clostridia bacterium]|nr:single-stranded DNA-binding protein [Clostridia bacterium]MDD4798350.1 single-stranded DNA-binding protein [Clostridia bacterium]
MLNRVVLIGRLTRDPELRYTPSGVAVASFTLAVDRNFKNAQGEREADFINIVVWRQLGENCANYLSKGKLAAVDGRLQIRSYDAKDGTKRIVAEVIAEDVRFLSPRDGSEGASANRSMPQNSTMPIADGSDDLSSLSDEEIPF